MMAAVIALSLYTIADVAEVFILRLTLSKEGIEWRTKFRKMHFLRKEVSSVSAAWRYWGRDVRLHLADGGAAKMPAALFAGEELLGVLRAWVEDVPG